MSPSNRHCRLSQNKNKCNFVVFTFQIVIKILHDKYGDLGSYYDLLINTNCCQADFSGVKH